MRGEPLFISTSTCVVFLLTTIIGNFGVSDADVVLRQNEQSTHPPGSKLRAGDTASSLPVDLQFGSNSPTSFSHSSANSRLNPQTELHFSTSTSALTQERQPLNLDFSQPGLRQASTPIGFHKQRIKRSAVDLDGKGDDEVQHLGYPLPLSMDDYWTLDRERLMDQVVIRALANPQEWNELRKTFDKVDGDLKELLSLEKRKQTTTNSSLGTTTGYPASTLSHSSRSDPNPEHLLPHDHHLKVKFAYHRVHDLNAAGQPTSRAIAAVVSLDTTATTENISGGGGSGNEIIKNEDGKASNRSGSGGLRASGESRSLAAGNGVATSSSTPFPHYEQPMKKRVEISSGGEGASSSTGESSSSDSESANKNNHFSNSFSRFEDKEKQFDFTSDKSESGKPTRSRDDERVDVPSENTLRTAEKVVPRESVIRQKGPAEPHHLRQGADRGHHHHHSVNADYLMDDAGKAAAEGESLHLSKAAESGDTFRNHHHHHHNHHHTRHHHHHQDNVRNNYGNHESSIKKHHHLHNMKTTKQQQHHSQQQHHQQPTTTAPRAHYKKERFEEKSAAFSIPATLLGMEDDLFFRQDSHSHLNRDPKQKHHFHSNHE